MHFPDAWLEHEGSAYRISGSKKTRWSCRRTDQEAAASQSVIRLRVPMYVAFRVLD